MPENTPFKIEINSIEDFERFINIVRTPEVNELVINQLIDKLKSSNDALEKAVQSQSS